MLKLIHIKLTGWKTKVKKKRKVTKIKIIWDFNSEIMVFVKWWEILIKQIIKVFLKKGKINFYPKIYIELKRKKKLFTNKVKIKTLSHEEKNKKIWCQRHLLQEIKKKKRKKLKVY